MNTFMMIKMEASGYPVGCMIPQEKQISSSAYIVYNAGRRTDAKLNEQIYGKCAQNPDRCTKRVCGRAS